MGFKEELVRQQREEVRNSLHLQVISVLEKPYLIIDNTNTSIPCINNQIKYKIFTHIFYSGKNF